MPASTRSDLLLMLAVSFMPIRPSLYVASPQKHLYLLRWMAALRQHRRVGEIPSIGVGSALAGPGLQWPRLQTWLRMECSRNGIWRTPQSVPVALSCHSITHISTLQTRHQPGPTPQPGAALSEVLLPFSHTPYTLRHYNLPDMPPQLYPWKRAQPCDSLGLSCWCCLLSKFSCLLLKIPPSTFPDAQTRTGCARSPAPMLRLQLRRKGSRQYASNSPLPFIFYATTYPNRPHSYHPARQASTSEVVKGTLPQAAHCNIPHPTKGPTFS